MRLNDRFFRLISFFLLIIAFSIVAYRAFLLGITHDEALTLEIINGDTVFRATANHHFLNTWLSSLSVRLPFTPEFALRLPNVLSFLLFGYSAIGLCSACFRKSSGLFICTVLLYCPYLLDYFSLARGYGLSLAFLLFSLWQLVLFWREEKYRSKYLLLSSVGICLGLLANLNLVNIFLVIHLLLLVRVICLRKIFTWTNLVVLVLAAACFCFCLVRLLFLKDQNQLYFGTDSFQATIDFVVSDFLYVNPDRQILFCLRLLFWLILVGGITWLWLKKSVGGLLFGTVIAMSFAMLWLQHVIFDTLYPVDRSSICYIPLVVVFTGFLLETTRKKKHSGFIEMSVPIICIIFAFSRSWQITSDKTFTWPEFQHAKSAFLLIKSKVSGKSCQVTWIYEPIGNYYRTEYHIPLNPVQRAEKDFTADFLVLQDKRSIPNYRLLGYYPEDKIAVFERLP